MTTIPDIGAFMSFHAAQRGAARGNHRDDGFYWIRLKGERWIIAEWIGDGWIIARAHETIRDEEVAEVKDARLLSPDDVLIPEYMRGVPKHVPKPISDALERLKGVLG